MKKELGTSRCGLACCLCAKNTQCNGCHADDCTDSVWCEVRKCCIEKDFYHCFECGEAEVCQKGILAKLKPHTFTVFAKKYGMDKLLECLENNEKHGVVYHREGIVGDYDDFTDMDELLKFIEEGKYEGAKPMLMVDNIDDRAFGARLLNDMFDELPDPKKKR